MNRMEKLLTFLAIASLTTMIGLMFVNAINTAKADVERLERIIKEYPTRVLIEESEDDRHEAYRLSLLDLEARIQASHIGAPEADVLLDILDRKRRLR